MFISPAVSISEIVNSAEAKTWLDSTGTTCLAFSDTKRAEFTRWMWNKIQEIGRLIKGKCRQ